MHSRVSANSLLIPTSTPCYIPCNKRIVLPSHVVMRASTPDNLSANRELVLAFSKIVTFHANSGVRFSCSGRRQTSRRQERCGYNLRDRNSHGLLVINFNRISARAIVTSLSMADINRARVSDPRLYYHRYRVVPAFMMISVSRTVPHCANRSNDDSISRHDSPPFR